MKREGARVVKERRRGSAGPASRRAVVGEGAPSTCVDLAWQRVGIVKDV